jgi:indolepyruvate ferredoxin oxidoreductase beta subunit
MTNKNIMIVGVGGQGTLLASRILGNALLSCGYDVRVSEVHGMSQRGGSVVTYVKFGDKVYSPVICRGEADIILSFEQLEAARWLPYLKKDGIIITNTQKINPMPVVTGQALYPDNLTDKIKAKGVRILAVDAMSLAREAGNEKAVNVILLGIMTAHLGIPPETIEETIRTTVPAKYLEANIKAYELGRKYK